MKAITVRYFAATNTKGARVKAFDMDGNSVVASRDFELSVETQARQVAFDLMTVWGSSMKQPLKITGQGQINRNDYVFTVGYAETPVTVTEANRLQREAVNG